MNKFSLVSVSACAFLAACGGGSTSGDPQDSTPVPPSVVPLSSSGFATSNMQSFDGETITLPQAAGFSISTSDGFNPGTTPVTIEVAADGQSITLTMNGVTKSFVIDGDGDFIDPMTNEGVSILDQNENFPISVVIAGLLDGDDGFGAILPIGFDTDPAKIATTQGTFTYSGTSIIEIALIGPTLNPDGDIAEGTFELIANFDTDKVTGSFNMIDESGPGDPEVLVAFELDEGSIVQNGFSDSFSATQGNALFVNPVVEDANYTGRFFGVDGGAVGVTISGVLTSDDEPDYLIQGALVGERP